MVSHSFAKSQSLEAILVLSNLCEVRELVNTKMRGVRLGEYVQDVVKIAGCGVCY